MKKLKQTLLVFLLVFIAKSTFAGEGMWLPLLLKQLNQSEMRDLGMKISAKDIYNINSGSLKDAVAQFNGNCTAEMVSPEGLLIVSHHCSYDRIQKLSTLNQNYIQKGFWAMSRAEELPNPGLTITFLVRIEDVTKQILKNITDDMKAVDRKTMIDKNIEEAIKQTDKAEHEEVSIKPFFEGNQYYSFVTINYQDVRFVGAPPSSIGNFGADTDNWVWPRHTADFALFRIYADENNLPATYSPDNIPFKPKHYFPVSLDGIEEGDFTMLFGYPRSTREYLPSVAVKQIMESLHPARIRTSSKVMKIMDRAMRIDPEVQIKYVSKFAMVANTWKKLNGEVQGLKSTNALDKKIEFEKEFQKRVDTKKNWKTKYGTLLSQFDELYNKIEPFAINTEYYNEITRRNTEVLVLASQLFTLVELYYDEGVEAFANRREEMMPYFNNFFKNFNSDIDRSVFSSLLEMYVNNVNAEYIPDYLWEEYRATGWNYAELAYSIYRNSNLTDRTKFFQMINQKPFEAIQSIESDKGYKVSASLAENYNDKIIPQYEALRLEIDELQRLYMQAQIEVFPEYNFYPDANNTMRVSYGKVEGYSPRDAVYYTPITYLDGVIEKYKPGDYEFDVPDRILELYEKKDYGKYGKNEKMPVCFIGTNHTTSGNAGSPVVDAYGNLIGLHFDRAWEGTMSDIHYDPSICRNIMVDIRYVLFLIDKFARAGHLVEEMTLIHPKN